MSWGDDRWDVQGLAAALTRQKLLSNDLRKGSAWTAGRPGNWSSFRVAEQQ